MTTQFCTTGLECMNSTSATIAVYLSSTCYSDDDQIATGRHFLRVVFVSESYCCSYDTILALYALASRCSCLIEASVEDSS